MNSRLVVGDKVGYKTFSGEILIGIIKEVTDKVVGIKWRDEDVYTYNHEVIKGWGDLFFIIKKRIIFASKAEEINSKIKVLEERFKNRKKK